MINYSSDGISVSLSKTVQSVEYRDANNVGRTRFEILQDVEVDFLGFNLVARDLTELCFTKSCIQFFIQNSWRSKTKKGLTKIDLEESLDHQTKSLWFVARQKNMKHYLQIAHVDKSTGEQQDSFLSVQQAMMLDMALAKALNGMTPQVNAAKQERHEIEPLPTTRRCDPRVSAYLQKCWDEC